MSENIWKLYAIGLGAEGAGLGMVLRDTNPNKHFSV